MSSSRFHAQVKKNLNRAIFHPVFLMGQVVSAICSSMQPTKIAFFVRKEILKMAIKKMKRTECVFLMDLMLHISVVFLPFP